MQSVQNEQRQSEVASQQAPRESHSGLFRTQLRQLDFEAGSALLTPVQAKGGITIGAHKQGGGAAPAKGASGIKIGAHKATAAGTPAKPSGGIKIGAHKQAAPPDGGGAAGPAPGAGGPPKKPLPTPPGGGAPHGAAMAGGPPKKPLPAPPVAGVAASAPGAAAAPPVEVAPGGAAVAGPAAEQQLENEDRDAFFDVDGYLALFDDEASVTSYYQGRVPSTWRSIQSGHMATYRKCKDVGVSDFDLFALIGYSGPGYAPMNRLTRGQMKSKRFTKIFKPYTEGATRALDRLDDKTVKHTQRGWRNIPKGDDAIIENLYNREFVDENGFMSTTTNTTQGFFAGPVSINIAGTKGVDIKLLSMVPSEGEVLYKPGSHFAVRRFQRNSDVEQAWKSWHQDNSLPKPGRPWFEVDLEEQ